MITANTLHFYIFNMRLGLRRVIGGVDYFRLLSYPLVLENLNLKPHTRLLDMGSGCSIFPLFVAYLSEACKYDLNIYVTDIYDQPLLWQHRMIRKLGLQYILNKRLFIRKEDAKILSFPDEYFDYVSCISTIEHIPEDGDILAMHQIKRTLKPGGSAVLTVPYSQEYSERHHPEWGFERFYSEKQIRSRLLCKGLSLVRKQFIAETTSFASFYFRLNKSARRILGFSEIVPSILFLRVSSVRPRQVGICLTLVKS